MAQAAWVCEVHGRLPVGAGFTCAACRDDRPRQLKGPPGEWGLIECWRGCQALRKVREGRVAACVRCGDAAYDYDVP
jgi:hypothetical protein